MRGFTAGSSSGWTGDLYPSSSSVRILDVTLEDECSRRVTVVVAPSTADDRIDRISPVLDAEVFVEWGTIDGTSQRAEIDVGSGTTFGVSGTRLIVSLRAIEPTSAHPRKSRYRATASLGEAREHFPPLRAVRLGSLEVGATSSLRVSPAHARRLNFARTPQGAVDVRYFDSLNNELAAARSRESEEPRLIVPPDTRGFLVTNIGTERLANLRAIFELGFC